MTSKLSSKQSQRLLYISVGCLTLSVVLLIASLAVQSAKPAVTANPKAPYTAGQLVSGGSASLKIENVEFKEGQPGFAATADKRYLVLDFSVSNHSQQPINVLAVNDTYVKDTAGNVVYLTPYALERPFHSGELPAGESVRGQLSFLVPHSGSLKFYVDAIWSGGVIPFTIQ